MIYYKAFNKDMTCLGYQFAVGKTFTVEGPLKMCQNGFHCCQNILYCLLYYPVDSRFCEVQVGAEHITDVNKTVTRKITLMREITGSELVKLLTGTVIESNGTKYWYKEGQLHRDGDLPAIIWLDGTKRWYKEGQLHRDGDLPAEIWSDGIKRLYKNGLDLPAIIWLDCTKMWYKNGQRHRDGDLPAVIRPDGTKMWYKNGQRHRDKNLPAVIRPDGSKLWYKKGQQHRDGDLQAVIQCNCTTM